MVKPSGSNHNLKDEDYGESLRAIGQIVSSIVSIVYIRGIKLSINSFQRLHDLLPWLHRVKPELQQT